MAAAVQLGSLRVARDAPPVFLPDIDVYFKGDVAAGFSLLERLAAAGCRVVKGALIHDASICFDGPVEAAWYRPGHGMVREPYRRVIERHLLPLPSAEKIYRRARDMRLEVVLTVYDTAGADFAVRIGAAALKVASSNITHAALIRDVARRGLPLVLDTGRATHAEIARAVAWARGAGASQLVVQHSPAAPPAPVDQHHLRMMRALGERFDCPYGLSDHHAGHEMLVAAVALGASVLEKGVCPDDAADDIDLAHAARIGEVAAIARMIENTWRALGVASPVREPAPSTDRMGLVAARALAAGDRLDGSAVRFAMALPEGAVMAEAYDEVQGRRLARAVAAMQPIRWEDLAAGG